MRKQQRDKRVIGLTGGVGTGKTTVAAMFRGGGAFIIDADRIAHAQLARGTPAYREIVRTFGKGILGRGGIVDRRRLGKLVFGEKRLREELNAILHPRIIRRIREKIARSRKRFVVVDAPLLFETGLEKSVDLVIVVTASRSAQIRRCEARTGLSREEILPRIAAQLPLKDKVRSADFIIDNNGTLSKTKEQVDSIRRNLWRS